MARTLKDIFNDYPSVEKIEVAGYEENGLLALSADGRTFKILNDDFARELAELPGANTEAGHITVEGYRVRGGWNILKDAYKAFVSRSAIG